MYFDWLHKKTPENCSDNVLKKSFLGRFMVLEYFSTTQTTEFFFFLGLFKRLISAPTYVFWLNTQENTRKLQWQCPQKKFFGSVSGSRICCDYSKRPYLSFSRALEKNYISINLCILIDYTRKHPKIAVSMSSKKVFWVGFAFSNIFRLPETTEFFFF